MPRCGILQPPNVLDNVQETAWNSATRWSYSHSDKESLVAEGETRETIRALYEAYVGRNFDRFAGLLHQDIDWVIHGPMAVFPFAGLRRGRPAVLQALAGMAMSYSLDTYLPDFILVEGDRAAIMADVALSQYSTGRILRFRVANFLRIQDGQMIEFREFADSFDQVEQALGRVVEL
jgi:uncharacterized protein